MAEVWNNSEENDDWIKLADPEATARDRQIHKDLSAGETVPPDDQEKTEQGNTDGEVKPVG